MFTFFGCYKEMHRLLQSARHAWKWLGTCRAQSWRHHPKYAGLHNNLQPWRYIYVLSMCVQIDRLCFFFNVCMYLFIYLSIYLFICVGQHIAGLKCGLWVESQGPRKNQSLNSLKSQQKADRFPEIATNEIVKPGRTFNGLVLGKIHRKLGQNHGSFEF